MVKRGVAETVGEIGSGRGDRASLFAQELPARPLLPPAAVSDAPLAADGGRPVRRFVPQVDEELIDLFARCPDPRDPVALCRLFSSRLEAENPHGDKALAELWRSARPVRAVSAEDILCDPSTAMFVKELFNYFFRDDLYGRLRNDDTLIMSSGAACEECFGLSAVGKAAITYALERDWYGYSDSTGRINAREALAGLENARLGSDGYSGANIAITFGATHAINSVADLVLGPLGANTSPAIAAIPNYPPLVRAVTRAPGIRLVPLACEDGIFSVDPIIEALSPDTPLVLVQTVANPTGARIDEASLERLVNAASPHTIVLLDECHEFLGADVARSPARRAPNVVRVVSLSKFWSVPGMKLGWIIADDAVIRAFYEVASSSYGGPPSLFFTFLEVYGRFEQWRLENLSRPGRAELAQFDIGYGLTVDSLAAAYEAYVRDWTQRVDRLVEYRETFAAGLLRVGFDVVLPRYSINTLAFARQYRESYPVFRDLMARTNVSTYPGILNFCFGSGGTRFTSARSWAELGQVLQRFQSMVPKLAM